MDFLLVIRLHQKNEFNVSTKINCVWFKFKSEKNWVKFKSVDVIGCRGNANNPKQENRRKSRQLLMSDLESNFMMDLCKFKKYQQKTIIWKQIVFQSRFFELLNHHQMFVKTTFCQLVLVTAHGLQSNLSQLRQASRQN